MAKKADTGPNKSRARQEAPPPQDKSRARQEAVSAGRSKKSASKTTKKRSKKKSGGKASNPRGLEDIPFPLPRVEAKEKQRAKRLLAALDKAYPDATIALEFSNPHELLIATILSAQCTDVAVNKATPALFETFPTPADYANASPEEIEPYIRSLGFFRNKSKAIHSAMTDIVEKHGGEVPPTMDELLALQGVARKTANVVLGNGFGLNEGVVVDAHVQRLSQRLCLVERGATVHEIERKLMVLFPRERWKDVPHLLIWHGRGACTARRKGCAEHAVCRGYGGCCELRGKKGHRGESKGTKGGRKGG